MMVDWIDLIDRLVEPDTCSTASGEFRKVPAVYECDWLSLIVTTPVPALYRHVVFL